MALGVFELRAGGFGPKTKSMGKYSSIEEAKAAGAKIADSYSSVFVLSSGGYNRVVEWDNGEIIKDNSPSGKNADSEAYKKKEEEKKAGWNQDTKDRNDRLDNLAAQKSAARLEKSRSRDKKIVGRMNDGFLKSTLTGFNQLSEKAQMVVFLIFIFVFIAFMTLLSEVIAWLSSIISWISYPFHFLFGNSKFFNFSLLADGSKVLDNFPLAIGQFLLLLVVTVGAIFVFYKLVTSIKKTADKIWVPIIVFLIGGFLTTNTSYVGNGLINKNAQHIVKSFPGVLSFGSGKRLVDKKVATDLYYKNVALKKAEADKKKAEANKKKAEADKKKAEANKLLLEKANKTLSSAPNYDDHAKKLNEKIAASLNIKSTFRQAVRSEIRRLGNNADLNHIYTAGVTDMSSMFSRAQFYDIMHKFNGDISKWDVSNVTDMSSMFYSSPFNGDISKWDVSNVTKMGWMFNGSKFNGDISKWDVSNVTDMRLMFLRSKFNGDISKWDVSNVADMSEMFYESKFNGDISKWDVSNVTDMRLMFLRSKFNGDISNWDVSSVTYMEMMFDGSQFNGDVSKWDVSKVKDMSWGWMFNGSKFNGDISKWAKKPNGYKRK